MYDEDLARMLAKMDEVGWMVCLVGGGPCECVGCEGVPDEGIPFAYTVGLSTLGFPEVITYGMPRESAHACLNDIGMMVRQGRPPAVGAALTGFFCGSVGYLLPVADTSDLVTAREVYPDVEAVQLVWPDGRGMLPWQRGYDHDRWPQPLVAPSPARRR